MAKKRNRHEVLALLLDAGATVDTNEAASSQCAQQTIGGGDPSQELVIDEKSDKADDSEMAIGATVSTQ